MPRYACIAATTGVIFQEMTTESVLLDTSDYLYRLISSSLDLSNKHYNISIDQIVDGLLITLPQAKADAWGAIKSERDTREFGTFAWDGSIFDCNPVSTARITGAFAIALAAKSANAPYSNEWTLADNTRRTLSADDMLAVGITLGQTVSNLHSTAAALRVQIESATTIAQLGVIQWPT